MLKRKNLAVLLAALMLLSAVFFTASFAQLGAGAPSSANSGNGNSNGNGLILGNGEYEGRLLVKFKNGSGKGNVAELGGAEEIGNIAQLGVKIMKVKNPKAIAKLLEHNKHIEYAEEDTLEELALVPNDPGYRTYGASYARIMNAEPGWDFGMTSNVTVAVLDTGFNPHPDLPAPKRVYNAVSKNSNVTDIHGHGTLVSGTLCGVPNNGIGGAGVIWDYSDLMFIRISEMAGGSAYISDMTTGILYAADNGAKIMSISYGGTSNDTTRKNAIDYAIAKGCIIFAATGNESTSAALTNVCYPARHDNVMGVGALSSATARASYSNGGVGLDVMASGSWYAPNYTGGYSIWSGTSCATPVAAGVCALIWQILPDYSNLQIMQLMKDFAKDINTAGWDTQTGYGVADMQILLGKAAEYAGSGYKPPVGDYTAPVITLNGSATMTVYLGNTFTDPGCKAIDNVDGDITDRVIVTGSVNTNAVGTYTLVYSATDNAGNTGRATRTVNVIRDTVPPVITLTGGSSINVNRGTPFVEPGYMANDNADGDITSKVVVTGTVNTDVAGAYKLTYTVADKAGNTATAVRTVNVAPNRATFGYSYKGKAGTSYTDTFKIGFPGIATITSPSLDNKTQISITIKDAAGVTAFTGAFTAGTSKTAILAAGNYTVVTKIDSANGNVTVNANIAIVESETPPPVPSTAPTVKLIGSAQIVLHLGGSPYVEQGVTATDTVDGDIGSKAVIESNADTSKAGNYTVKYTVTNTAGQSASVTRGVEIVAPQTRTVPGASFSFAPKGKAGTSFTYNFDAAASGSAALAVSGLNKTTVSVTVKDAAGATVYNGSIAANGTFNFNVSAGRYTAVVSIVEANGNASCALNVSTPGGIETYFPKPEVRV